MCHDEGVPQAQREAQPPEAPGAQLPEAPGAEPAVGDCLAAISGLEDPVRRGLYDYVSGRAEPVGRDEAATATGVGRPLAAYHLDKLVDLGLLTADYQRPPGRGGPGAGRPAKVYARSAREFAVTVPPREYELAARLMALAVESDLSGAALAALRRTARQFGAELARDQAAQGPGAGPAEGARVGRVAARQRLMAALAAYGFEPAMVSASDGAGDGGSDGDVRLRNCPFHQLAARHREVVCGMNLALVSGLADEIGSDALRACLDPKPGHCCVAIKVSLSAA